MLASNGSCAMCPQGCLLCDSAAQCQECSPAFYLHGQQCSPCTQGCATCNQEGCLSCAVGYFEPNCTKCPPGCRSCIASNICEMCVPGYFMFSPNGSTPGLPVCYPCADPCVLCEGPFTCLSCSIGYSLGPMGVCTPCPGNFSFCDDDENIMCLPGFVLSSYYVNGSLMRECLSCP